MSHCLIIEAPFYTDVCDLLREGAIQALKDARYSYDIITVPGALEIPAALKFSLTKDYDAYIILGCVIRGETSHYDIVCNESARGIYDLVTTYDLALGNALLTVENKEQAIVRADPEQKNKGGEAAKAALTMLNLKKQIIL